MSKEAIMFCMDVSSSMRPHLPEAVEGMRLLIESKILQTKQNEIGVVLFGTNETNNPLAASGRGGYENVTLFEKLDRPSVSLSLKLETIEAGDGSADLIDGLVVAVDVMFRKIGTKKYIKTIYLITNAEDEIQNPEDLQATVGHMIDQEINLVVIGINFKHTSTSFNDTNDNGDNKESDITIKKELSSSSIPREEENNEKEISGSEEEEEEEESVKIGNEKMLLSIVQSTKRGAVLRADDLVKLMSQLQTKTVRPTRNKCVLILPTPSITSSNTGDDGADSWSASDGAIDVLVFARAKRSSAPSLKKEVKAAYDPSDPKSGGVKTDRTYRNPLHPDAEVLPQHLVKGYRYGKDYVPVSAADATAMKIESDRASITVMGFASKHSINLASPIGDTKCVIPADNSLKSETALMALATSLDFNEKIMMARFVGRKNADPQLVAIAPDPESLSLKNVQLRLIMHQIPFSDDQRGFTFPSFKNAPKSQQPSEEQYTCMSNLIKAYEINSNQFIPELIFNPLNQRLRSAMISRIHNPTCDLPEIDKRVKAYMEPNQNIIKAAIPVLNHFKDIFKFVTIDNNANKKRKHFWSDITGDDGDGGDNSDIINPDGTSTTSSSSSSSSSSSLNKKIPKKEIIIGSVNPVSDFELLLNNKDNVLFISEIFQKMLNRIETLIIEGASTPYYNKAIKCLISLRKQSLLHSESELFNTFLKNNIKKNYGNDNNNSSNSSNQHGEIWDLLIDENTSLISSIEDSAIYDVSQQDSIDFLKDTKQVVIDVVPPTVVKKEDSDDDMFDDME